MRSFEHGDAGQPLRSPADPASPKGRRTMLKTLPALAALAIASVLVIPTVSQAAEIPSVTVSYADLNLSSDVDQNRLERRIAFAAVQVCGISDPRDLNYVRAVGECRSE